jgi:Transposase DDE domain
VCFGSFAPLLTYLSMSAIRPISDLQFEVANTETGVIQDRARNLVERFFKRIKPCRRLATRYDKLAANDLAFIKLAAIRIWLPAYESTP